MKNYDIDYGIVTHLVKVTLQDGQHKGSFVVEISGNLKGFDVLSCIVDSIIDGNYAENNIEFELIESDYDEEISGFSCMLSDENGDKVGIEYDIDLLEGLIVGLEIIDVMPDQLL